MSSIGGGTNRTVVPRWRTSNSFAGAPESSSLPSKGVTRPVADSWFDRALLEWRAEKTVGLLADLFSIAIVEGKNDYFEELSSAVLAAGDRVPVALQGIASGVARGIAGTVTQKPLIDLTDQAVVNQYISTLKAKAIESPNNGFVWNDLSYAYNLVGEKKKSEKAMLVALKVSSSHRLIARGASRLYMHHEDTEKALSVLKKAQGFSRDPWLISAHIAISQAFGEESNSLSMAKKLLERVGAGHRFSSELGMALATQEMWSGKIKKAKIMARESSIEPTENALAQAVWMSPRLRSDVVTKDAVDSALGAYEARSWDAYYKGEWANSVENSVMWLRDEPYSVVPALQGSFVSATFMNDYELSVKLSLIGLRHNPESWGLRNNLVVALAMSNDLVRADEEFERLDEPPAGVSDHAVWMATKGLLSYRHDEIENARAQYVAARSAFEKINDRTSQLTLALYQSLEEAKLGNTLQAEALVNDVYRKLGFRREQYSIAEALGYEVANEKKVRVI